MTFTAQERNCLQTLETLLRIPSVSAQSEYTGEVRRAAEFLQQHLAQIGLHLFPFAFKIRRYPVVAGGADRGVLVRQSQTPVYWIREYRTPGSAPPATTEQKPSILNRRVRSLGSNDERAE